MFLFKKLPDSFQEGFARTGFSVSLFSLIFFWICDVLRPGFVSRYFSLLFFLLLLFVFGVWWGIVAKKTESSSHFLPFLLCLFGCLLCVVTWNIGEGFGAFRLLITLFAFGVPFLFSYLLHEQ